MAKSGPQFLQIKTGRKFPTFRAPPSGELASGGQNLTIFQTLSFVFPFFGFLPRNLSQSRNATEGENLHLHIRHDFSPFACLLLCPFASHQLAARSSPFAAKPRQLSDDKGQSATLRGGGQRSGRQLFASALRSGQLEPVSVAAGHDDERLRACSRSRSCSLGELLAGVVAKRNLLVIYLRHFFPPTVEPATMPRD